MVKDTVKQKLRTRLAEYEGSIPHMYLDSKGLVTVGVGHLLSTVADAQKLAFVIEKTKMNATADDIKTDFESVKKQPKNKIASFYKPATKLTLPQAEIDKLTTSHIEAFYKDLKIIYTDFDNYPDEVQLALFDIIFNVGPTNLKNTWPNFNKAIRDKDWKKAADNSGRAAPVSALRNEYVKDLLEKAAKNTKVDKK